MTNTWEFKEQANAVQSASDLLDQGVDCVLIRTIRRKPQGVFYVLAAIGNLDGITPPGGCAAQQLTLKTHPSWESPKERPKPSNDFFKFCRG